MGTEGKRKVHLAVFIFSIRERDEKERRANRREKRGFMFVFMFLTKRGREEEEMECMGGRDHPVSCFVFYLIFNERGGGGVGWRVCEGEGSEEVY